jgi:hypothetical protein
VLHPAAVFAEDEPAPAGRRDTDATEG